MESGSAGEWESFGSRSLWVVFGLILLPNMLIGTGLKLIICKKKSVEVKIPEWTSDTTPGNDQNLRNTIPIPKVKHSMFGCCVCAFFRVSHQFMDRCKNIFVSQSSKQSKQNNKISCFSTASTPIPPEEDRIDPITSATLPATRANTVSWNAVAPIIFDTLGLPT